MISLKNISKSYGQVNAVKDVSLEIGQGELFGLIGPDGAGKTSIFRILTTLLLADEGSAQVKGMDVLKDYKKIRNSIGYMPGRFSLYQDLSIEENLNFFATVFNTTVEENYELIRDIYVQIEPFKKRRAGKLSGGMKQKLALCCALIHKPEVLFLDEPTTGVDPVSRKEFWEMLHRLKKQDITIMVSTPYMDEASQCDRIALIQNGKILAVDNPTAINENFPGNIFTIKGPRMSTLLQSLKNIDEVQNSYAFGESAHVIFKNKTMQVNEISQLLENRQVVYSEINLIKPGIEDSFIALLQQ